MQANCPTEVEDNTGFRKKKWEHFEEYKTVNGIERKPVVDQTNQDIVFNVIHSYNYNYTEVQKKVFVELISMSLIQALREILQNRQRFKRSLHAHKPNVDVQDLYFVMDDLRNAVTAKTASDQENLNTLIEFLKEYFNETIHIEEKMKNDKTVSYDMLWVFYTPGSKVIYQCEKSGQNLGGIIDSAYETVIWNLYYRSVFVVNIKVIDFDGRGLKRCHVEREIEKFSGEQNFESLPVILAEFSSNINIKEEIITNGKLFFDYCQDNTKYMNYNGTLYHFITKTNGDKELEKINTNGRIMMDISSFAIMNPNYEMGNALRPNAFQGKRNDYLNSDELNNENNYFLASALVYGFSFELKIWGQFEVINLSPITFRKRAFSNLIIPEDKKKMLKQLVTYYKSRTINVSIDHIDKKGNGCIILCHGPPGTGKTLTAEVMAESIKNPLWIIGTNELGIDAVGLESKLNKVLDVAYRWKAILLLDEADIYLERRNEADLNRNMMVGVFLRQLEYYQGILFLTTNRGMNFDKAVCSRISLFFHYPELDKDNRRDVWTKLIQANKLDFDVNKVVSYNLNGRAIRNILQIARITAENNKLTANSVIRIIEEYMKDFNKLNIKDVDENTSRISEKNTVNIIMEHLNNLKKRDIKDAYENASHIFEKDTDTKNLLENKVTIDNAPVQIPSKYIKNACSTLRELCGSDINDFIAINTNILKYTYIYKKIIFLFAKRLILFVRDLMESYLAFECTPCKDDLDQLADETRAYKECVSFIMNLHKQILADFTNESNTIKKLPSCNEFGGPEKFQSIINNFKEVLTFITSFFSNLEDNLKLLVINTKPINSYYAKCKKYAQRIIDDCNGYNVILNCEADLIAIELDGEDNYFKSWLTEKDITSDFKKYSEILELNFTPNI
ncbi:451_t:CDS:2 [Gigaspora margarita]|uniref:451_t:CDS:1 n=1 Tax=Gigaspora margarita TaxID=4874 RepID=A0ABN7US48_GIGMA|nr:451_t:CDS:2 [Gigaspora margarita]